MGLLKNLFKSTTENQSELAINWIPLINLEQLDDIVEASNKKPIAIFKYSTRCGLSRMVLKDLERNHELSENEPQWYFLDLIKYRSLSNEISSRFNVIHESPQIIILQHGKVIYHNSHSGIDLDTIKKLTI